MREKYKTANRKTEMPQSGDPSVFRFPSSVLLAVTGMSPAILTETAWALAQEKPRCLPGKVVVFATTRSRDQIRKELLVSGVWEKLRRAVRARDDELVFSDAGDHIRVISRRGQELEDLRTPEDNRAAADFILDHLRQFTENPDTRIVASIAGGRKTMGALLYGCMTLIARETDRITHVLVDERLEQRRDPKFYFPQNKAEARGVQLAEIPFVPLRNRFVDLGRMPGTFQLMILKYARALRTSAPARVRLTETGVEVNGQAVDMSTRLRTVLKFLIDLNQKGEPIPPQSGAEEMFRKFLEDRDPQWARTLIFSEDLKRALSDIRTRFSRAGITWAPGLRNRSLHLPPFELIN
jgi:CRISPR-associated protein (TIGR02584 family)